MNLQERFARGDPEAFELLFRQFYPEVRRWLMRLVRDAAAASRCTPCSLASDALHARNVRWLQTFGRLRQGGAVAGARAISSHLAQTYPENTGHEAFVTELETGVARRLETLFAILLGLAGLVALIVCTNVANLLMLRGAARRHEIGNASWQTVQSPAVASSWANGASPSSVSRPTGSTNSTRSMTRHRLTQRSRELAVRMPLGVARSLYS